MLVVPKIWLSPIDALTEANHQVYLCLCPHSYACLQIAGGVLGARERGAESVQRDVFSTATENERYKIELAVGLEAPPSCKSQFKHFYGAEPFSSFGLKQWSDVEVPEISEYFRASPAAVKGHRLGIRLK